MLLYSFLSRLSYHLWSSSDSGQKTTAASKVAGLSRRVHWNSISAYHAELFDRVRNERYLWSEREIHNQQPVQDQTDPVSDSDWTFFTQAG